MWDFGFLPFFLLLFYAHFTICRISARLLSAAQFVKKNAFTPVYCCYTKHNSKNLFSGVVICGTFYEKLYFSIPCCYGQHSFSVCRVRLLSAAQFRSAGFLLPGLLNAAHFTERHQDCNGEHNSKKFFFVVVIPDTFQKSHPKLRPQNFCAKNIFLRCYRRHIVAQHTARLLDSAQQGWNPPHSFVVIFDIAIPYF